MNSTRNGAGNYRRTKNPNLERPSSGGVGYDTLHKQQREKREREAALDLQIQVDAAQIAAGRLCVICEGLDQHFTGCPETWKSGETEGVHAW